MKDQATEQALRGILQQFESGEAEQARAAIRALTAGLTPVSEPRRPVNRVSPLLKALWLARNAGDRSAAFHVQIGLDGWIQSAPHNDKRGKGK
jgi:hypothetical protein